MIIKRNDLLPKIQDLYKKNNVAMKEINIGGIGDDTCQNKDIFNDYFWLNIGQNLWFWKGTTNPGKHTTEVKEGGGAHLCYMYHEAIWALDIHAANNPSFKHEALCQREEKGCKPVKIWRDVNRDYTQEATDLVQTGFFGINFHRASAIKVVEAIGDYSAGCQVSQDVKDFNFVLNTIKEKMTGMKNIKYLFDYLLVKKEEIDFTIEG